MQMKNKKLEVLLILAVFAVLVVVFANFFPEIKLPFTENAKIKFLSFNELFDFSSPKENLKADSITENLMVSDSAAAKSDSLQDLMINGDLDNLQALLDSLPRDSNFVNPKTDQGTALDDFFTALLNDRDSLPIHIAHYGDSQLEGNRVTGNLRQKFQEKFGGSGVGFVPFRDIASNINYSRYSSPNWTRYTVFHDRIKGTYYGMSGEVFRFNNYARIKNDSAKIANGGDSTLVIGYDKAILKVKHTLPYRRMSIMYGKGTTKNYLKIYNDANNTEIYSDSLNQSDYYVKKPIKLSYPVNNLKVELSGEGSLDYYGLMFEGDTGIYVDNYAIRGHSGDGLMLINPSYLAKQVKETNTRLVIFQFGANVVPSIKNDAGCKYIENAYYDLFKRFKDALPGVSVLVISVGDLAAKSNGQYVSYRIIPKIRDAQQRAAINAGCAFWDLHDAMGGDNSILVWTKKKLATYEGHLTTKGQEIMANLLFNTIMIEYSSFLLNNKSK